jgi:hexosaminidase
MEDYIPFVNRVQQIVAKYGKKAIGWDEIANATLQPGTTAQFWSNHENAQKALGQEAKILMSPANKAYLDMQYDSTSQFGFHWAGYIEVETAYNWNPEAMIPGITKAQILGVEAPLWSETIANINEVEYLLFPRLPGYAEIGWTAPSSRNWDEYKTRLANFGKHFEKEGINYYKSPQISWN